MKTIGLIGGMSWESSLEYYRILNETVKQRLGGFHSAECVLYSVDFEEIERLQHQDDWDALGRVMIHAAQKVERAGADFLLLCTNTMHYVAEEVGEAVRIPLLHIVDVTADAIKTNGQSKVGLLGTKFTMERDFYKQRLLQQHNIDVIIPDDSERDEIHRILYSELCLGEIKASSRETFYTVIEKLISRGAQGVILGCTEIPLIVKQSDYETPLFDTTTLHAEAAVTLALV
jgi:aspartate racemase